MIPGIGPLFPSDMKRRPHSVLGSVLIVYLVSGWRAIYTLAANPQQQCSSSDGSAVCSATSCDLDESFCTALFASESLYRFGGSAQAYRKIDVDRNHSASATVICDPDIYQKKDTKWRVASWPFSRTNRKTANKKKQGPPKIILNIYPMSTTVSDEDECCSSPLTSSSDTDAILATVEAWQTRPDGSYSSLRDRHETLDCRARVDMIKGDDLGGAIHLETVAPGSSGIMGGLGPSHWDMMPYGPPVIHLLVTSESHSPTLIDVPLLVDLKTLESKKFGWSDFRGVSWARSTTKGQPYSLTWQSSPGKNEITLDIVVYLAKLDGEEDSSPVSSSMCQSYLPLAPPSFFLEPISECSPFLLDYFDL